MIGSLWFTPPPKHSARPISFWIAPHVVNEIFAGARAFCAGAVFRLRATYAWPTYAVSGGTPLTRGAEASQTDAGRFGGTRARALLSESETQGLLFEHVVNSFASCLTNRSYLSLGEISLAPTDLATRLSRFFPQQARVLSQNLHEVSYSVDLQDANSTRC